MDDKKTKNALILTHLQAEGVCSFGQTLIDRGFHVSSVNVSRYGAEDIDALQPDLLVVMGGPVGVYQADDFPFLRDEIALLKARIKADLPTIGVCLGSQLLAAALGSTVYKGKSGKELGWNPLTLTEAGQQSPARHLCNSQTNMFHWHGDTFDLPEGTTLLASSGKYQNQIYSFGKNIIGLQCHPEVVREQLGEWMVCHQADISGDNALLDIQQLRRDIDKHIEILNKQAHLFFHEWLEQAGL